MSAERVWVKTSANNATPTVYHTDPECRVLARTDTAVEKPRSVVRADLPECKYCAGEVAPTAPIGDPQATRKQLLRATPEDVGLSPRGERR